MVTKQIYELIHSCVIQIFRVHFVYHSWFCLSTEWVHLIIPFLTRQVAVVHEIESEVGFAHFAQLASLSISWPSVAVRTAAQCKEWPQIKIVPSLAFDVVTVRALSLVPSVHWQCNCFGANHRWTCSRWTRTLDLGTTTARRRAEKMWVWNSLSFLSVYFCSIP